jgi:putative flippase GtrA
MVAHGRRFALYTVMGASTTVVFWTMQTSFFMIWQTQNMLMLGGALGLAIGYFVKYRLDKRFVFDRAKGAA